MKSPSTNDPYLVVKNLRPDIYLKVVAFVSTVSLDIYVNDSNDVRARIERFIMEKLAQCLGER